MKIFKQIVLYIENKKISITKIIFAVFAISFLRNLFELLYKYGYIYSKQNIIAEYTTLQGIFIHFTSFWIAIYLILVIILFLFTKKHNTIQNTMKFGMFGMFIILFPVLFDLIIGNKQMMLYPNDPRDLFVNFKYYFSLKKEIYGLSPGMRIEVFLVSVFSAIYVYLKNKKWYLALLSTFSVFTAITFFGLWVSFFSQIHEFGLHFSSDFLFTTSKFFSESKILNYWVLAVSAVYIFIIIISLSFIYFTLNKNQFISIFKNFRLSRVIHYFLMFIAGLALSKIYFLKQNGLLSDFKIIDIFVFKSVFDYLGILSGLTSIFLAFQAAVIFNDYYDFKIDALSNKNRPLINNKISSEKYLALAKLFVLFSLYLAYTVNTALFIFVLLTLMLSYMYSNEPFRLKKYFLLNNFIIGLISLLVFHSGATLMIDDRTFTLIPPVLSYTILFGFTVVSMIKDIKDYEGDKRNGIQTVVTLFGLKVGKIIITILISATILVVLFVLKIEHKILISLLFATTFIFIMSFIKKYEKLVFLIYYLFIIIIFYEYISSLIS